MSLPCCINFLGPPLVVVLLWPGHQYSVIAEGIAGQQVVPQPARNVLQGAPNSLQVLCLLLGGNFGRGRSENRVSAQHELAYSFREHHVLGRLAERVRPTVLEGGSWAQ